MKETLLARRLLTGTIRVERLGTMLLGLALLILSPFLADGVRECRPRVARFLACANNGGPNFSTKSSQRPGRSQAQLEAGVEACLTQSGCAKADLRMPAMEDFSSGPHAAVDEAVMKCSGGVGRPELRGMEQCMVRQGWEGFAFPPSFQMTNSWRPQPDLPPPPPAPLMMHRYHSEFAAILSVNSSCPARAQKRLVTCVSRLEESSSASCQPGPVRSFLDEITHHSAFCGRLQRCQQSTMREECASTLEAVPKSLCSCARRRQQRRRRQEGTRQRRAVLACVVKEAGAEAVREVGMAQIRSIVAGFPPQQDSLVHTFCGFPPVTFGPVVDGPVPDVSFTQPGGFAPPTMGAQGVHPRGKRNAFSSETSAGLAMPIQVPPSIPFEMSERDMIFGPCRSEPPMNQMPLQPFIDPNSPTVSDIGIAT